MHTIYAGSSACNWACQDTGECLADFRRCNGLVDCNDGSDELNCGKPCTCIQSHMASLRFISYWYNTGSQLEIKNLQLIAPKMHG